MLNGLVEVDGFVVDVGVAKVSQSCFNGTLAVVGVVDVEVWRRGAQDVQQLHDITKCTCRRFSVVTFGSHGTFVHVQ